MNDGLQSVILFASLSSIGYGLWMIHPAAMFIGIGGLLMAGVIATRMFSVRKGQP